MDYSASALSQVASTATGVGVLAVALPNTSGNNIIALIAAAAGGLILISSVVSAIYKRVSR